MKTRPEWKDPIAKGNRDVEDYFDALGQEFFTLYKALGEHPAIEFSLTPEKHDQFNVFFSQVHLDQLPLTFTRLDYINLAKSLSISNRTADTYIFNIFNIFNIFDIFGKPSVYGTGDCWLFIL